MSVTLQENLFTGPIAGEYDLLRLMCPNAAILARRIGEFIGDWRPGQNLEGFEIGCGTGICTLGLLAARKNLKLTAVDSAPQMLDQARVNLAGDIKARRLALVEKDALTALRQEQVVLQLRDANSSALVREADDQRSRHVVMPLRL